VKRVAQSLRVFPPTNFQGDILLDKASECIDADVLFHDSGKLEVFV
jgi:hypothetical protein